MFFLLLRMFYRFQEGLQTLGVLEEIRSNPSVFEDLFTNPKKPLFANDLSSLFEVCFSPVGSNRWQQQNETICFWRDWLIDVEGKHFIRTTCLFRKVHHFEQSVPHVHFLNCVCRGRMQSSDNGAGP